MLVVPGIIASCLLIGVKLLIILIGLWMMRVDRLREPTRESTHH